MTSDGHAYARFRRALLTKNVLLVYAAARALPHISLEDPPRILVLLAEKRDERFERAAARFAARVTTERQLDLAESRYVLTLAEALRGSPDTVALVLRATVSEPTGDRARPGVVRYGRDSRILGALCQPVAQRDALLDDYEVRLLGPRRQIAIA